MVVWEVVANTYCEMYSHRDWMNSPADVWSGGVSGWDGGVVPVEVGSWVGWMGRGGGGGEWRREQGGGAPIPLAPQTPTVVFGGVLTATTSTQPPVFRNTGGCAYAFRNMGTWGLETSKWSSPSSMAGYMPRVGLKRGERDLR